MELADNRQQHKLHLLSIIGEVEGHECLSANTKTTKYEHVLPKLAQVEDDREIDGLLVLLNTVGGDVESGLAIAEMIASLSKPVVSLVLGGSHSIGVPLAVAADYSFIVPTGTMVIHPVRMSGTVIGAPQTYDYFQQMQDRITRIYCIPQSDEPGTYGRTDAEYGDADKRSWNHPGGASGGGGRYHQRSWGYQRCGTASAFYDQ